MNSSSTILVVDDNEPARYALRRMLQLHGYTVHEAATGAETLRAAEKNPDLIILDVHLPDLNGYEVCRRLKAAPKTSSIPVLHLSATFADSESRSEGLEQGADGYLTYPVEERELVANVEAILRARRAERLAREQSELLRVTLASIGEGVIATDLRQNVTFLNPVARVLTAWREDGAVGKPICDVLRLVDEETRQPVENPGTRALRGEAAGTIVSRVLLINRDGNERPIDASASPIRDAEGNIFGAVVIFRDITESRQVEASLRESNRHKDEFLAMLAHELRNPLAPISNAVHVLNAISSQEPAAVEARALIERQVEHLVRLVDDLLDVSRLTRGLIKLQKGPVDLATVVARAVESSRPLIEARRHVLDINLPDRPLPIHADAVRLAQVLLNLLNNAAKYTPEGGRIVLKVEPTNDEPPKARVSVRDTGMGIPAPMLPKIFDLFTQLERTIDRADGGLGIGLTLVRRLTELHDGSVSVSSPGVGQGAEFAVVLPLASAAQHVDDMPSEEGPEVPPRITTRRILVVDDNRDSTESLAMLLRLFGNDVRTAHDGRQALAIASSYLPELILLDLGLPGMSGFDVAKQVRTLPGLTKVTIVALTGYGTDQDRAQSRAAGFNAHFIKPVDITALQELLLNPALAS
jgi:PAS domain S-box-containing protein